MKKQDNLYNYLSSLGKDSLISLIMQKSFDAQFDLDAKNREFKELKQKLKESNQQNKALWKKIDYWRGKALQNKNIEKELEQGLTIEKLYIRIEELEGQLAYECECNKQFVECQDDLEIHKMALKLAVEDKCKIENELLTEQFGAEAKLMTPQKEQWYLERAKEIIDYESNND